MPKGGKSVKGAKMATTTEEEVAPPPKAPVKAKKPVPKKRPAEDKNDLEEGVEGVEEEDIVAFGSMETPKEPAKKKPAQKRPKVKQIDSSEVPQGKIEESSGAGSELAAEMEAASASEDE